MKTGRKNVVRMSTLARRRSASHVKYLDMLAAYLPDCIARTAVKKDSEDNLPNSLRFEAAVLFADVSGFTKLSEAMAKEHGERGAEMVAKHLNNYFTQLVKLITAEGGDVFKFAGDALIVLWTPVIFAGSGRTVTYESLTTMGRRAAQAALRIQRSMHHMEMAPGVFLSVKCGIGVGDVSIITLGGGTKQLSRVHWSEDGLKASVDERLQCTFYSSWIRGSRYMTLDRLHVLQQQVIKMAAGVADIKRSHQQYNSASLRGYFFPLEHLEAACPIEDLKADLEGVADSLEESGIFCKAMDVRTNKVTYTFMDPYLCLAARSRCTAIVQQELAEKVKELEREREESLRAMFMQKTVGLALEQNATPIEVEILKSSAKRSVFKAAAGQNWKTRHVRVKDNEFQVLKSGSVIQSCPIRNVTVERLQPEALKVPLDGRKFLVRVYATGHWLEKGKTQTGTKEFLLSLPDATAVEKITFWINSVKKKLSIEGRTGRSGRTGSVLAYKKKSKRRSMLDMIDETPEEESDPSIITMQIVLLSAENLSCSRHFTLGNYHRVYCVMHMDNYVVDTVGGQAPTRTVFSRLSKSDSNFNRNFTAVSSTCEWNVNLYFPVPKHKLGRSPSEVGAPPSERVSFLLGRVWERNFFGDDQFLGQFVLPVSELNRNDPGHVYSVELVGRDANEASLGTLRLSCSFTGTLVDGFEFYRIADSPGAIQKLQQPHDDDGSKWELKYTLWHEGSIPQVSNYSSKKLTKTKEGEFMVKSQERVEDEGAGVNDVPRDTSTPRLSIVKEDEEDEEVGTEGTEASSDGIATNEKTASATKEGPAAATSSPGERSKPSRMQRIVIAMKAENDRIKILNDFVEFCTLKSEKRGEQEGDNTSPATLPIDDMKEWVKRFRASRNVTGGGGAGK